jgi:hypothetical protein
MHQVGDHPRSEIVTLKSDKIRVTLHEDQSAFSIISCSVLLRMGNVSDKSCTDNQKTRFMFNNFFFENHAVYEIMWENIVQPGRPQMTIWRMHFSCWIPKATNTHSQYVILVAFPLLQLLHERASMLSHSYTVCFVKF